MRRWGLIVGLGAAVLVSHAAAQPLPPPPTDCVASLRVEQELGAYAKQLVVKLLVRAEKAEQDLAQIKQHQERTEEELTRVRQAWDDLKSKYAPPSN